MLRCSFYAIFDGHGGRKAAEYARANLLETVLASGFPRESVGETVLASGLPRESVGDRGDQRSHRHGHTLV